MTPGIHKIADPNRYRDLVGKCPPGFHWNGKACVPIAELEAQSMGKLPAAKEISEAETALLRRLLASLVSKRARKESMSEENARRLWELSAEFPQRTHELYSQLVDKLTKYQDCGIVDERGTVCKSPASSANDRSTAD